MTAWLVSGMALAQERSVDIELLRPTPSARGVPGVGGAATDQPGTVRIGWFGWYGSDPLVVEQDVGAPELSAVANRATTVLAISADLSRVVTLRAALPAALSWGSDPSGWSADGFGIGDLSGGFRLAAVRAGGFTGALGADLVLPSGRRDAWLGESEPRLDAGLSATFETGRVALSVDGGVVARSPVDTGAALTLGTELGGGAGVSVRALDDLSLLASAVASSALEPGTQGAEGLLGARWSASGAVDLDLMIGRGFSHGIGASDAVVLAAATLRRTPRAPPAPAAPKIEDAFAFLPEAEDPDAEAPEEPTVVEAQAPQWQAEQLARVRRGEVELRDPIRFAIGTAEVLEESRPLLEQVAEILTTTPEIVHVVIVGHASHEGGFETNYQLSLQRAAAVYAELLQRGVHPDRLSLLPMGEVVPARATETESADLARKVEFRIARALRADEAPPVYTPYDQLPTTGSAVPGPP